ncbi:MAG: serine protease [Luteolibacter sp.]
MTSKPFTALSNLLRAGILLFPCLAIVDAAGVAVVKEQNYHRDESATAFVYLERIDSGAPFVKFKTSTSESVVDRSKLAGYVDVPSSIPANVRNEEEATILRQTIQQMTAFASRFPKSEPLLKANIESFSKHLKEFDDGKIRLNGTWITRAEFSRIQKDLEEKAAQIKKEDAEMTASSEKRRREREQFELSQREKGLEEYEGSWLPRAQVAELQKRAIATKDAASAVDAKSITNCIFSILQVTDDGCLVTVKQGTMKQGGVNATVIFVIGGAKGFTADGDTYKGNLYWCGTYSYQNLAGAERTVNAYCLKREDALTLVKKKLGVEDIPGSPGSVAVAANPNLPECLRGAKSSGSGFFVGNQGYFVTNAHVVENSRAVSVYHGGEKLNAEVIVADKVADLAILKVEKIKKGLAFASREGDLGQDIFAIGFPQPELQGLEVKLTKGVISSRKGMADDDSKFQVDAAIQPGNSGGPLCDTSGNLVGVIVSGLNQIAVASVTGSIPQNVNYAIKAREVKRILGSKSIDISLPADPTPSIKNASDACGMVIVK